MPTLQCTSCGATYYTAAAGPHLALSPLMHGCEVCGSDEPLHIGVVSDADPGDAVKSVVPDGLEEARVPIDT